LAPTTSNLGWPEKGSKKKTGKLSGKRLLAKKESVRGIKKQHISNGHSTSSRKRG